MNSKTPGSRIPLEGTINTRDLGGYLSSDGRKVKYQRLVRTDYLGHITDNDIAFLHDILKARYEVDMRGSDEIRRNPNRPVPGLQLIHMPIQDDLNEGYDLNPHTHYDIEDQAIKGTLDYLFRMDLNGDLTNAFEKVYRDFLSPFGAEHYAKFLRLCLDNQEGCILFHCADGKDRSGLAAAILLTCLGVDHQTIIKDYLRTNENTKEKALYREKYLRDVCHVDDEIVINSIKMIAGVRENWLEAAFDEMKKQAGSIPAFIHDKLLLSNEDICILKDNYLE